ncbi:hypothetical protein KIPB_006546 [Kipferlia bialata]|uniref:Uncharacterized protein n=1 Tax=Kipferlia bialata TaxID=797122 RepID=A0A9K3CX76_9EUKA|nr:hypothetical protein KIPB_006546 [Kipferlia bialata]|eukprot:g6546.t1
MTNKTTQFQCPCGALYPDWTGYAEHAAECTLTHTGEVKEVLLPLFHSLPLSDITKYTIGYDRETQGMGEMHPFHVAVWKCLKEGGLDPVLYGGLGTVFASPSSDMDIAVRSGSFMDIKIQLVCGGLGAHVVDVGRHAESRARRHLKIHSPPDMGPPTHVDIVLAADNDGPQKRELFLNYATVLPVLPMVKGLLKTLAHHTRCLAPGTRGQRDTERNASELMHNSMWAVASVCPALHPPSLCGSLSPDVRRSLLSAVASAFDTSSLDTLMRDVMLAWCAYNSTAREDQMQMRCVVTGSPLEHPLSHTLPPGLHALVAPLHKGLRNGAAVPAVTTPIKQERDRIVQDALDVEEEIRRLTNRLADRPERKPKSPGKGKPRSPERRMKLRHTLNDFVTLLSTARSRHPWLDAAMEKEATRQKQQRTRNVRKNTIVSPAAVFTSL